MPKVSIIVPNYNHAKYLSQRLESIFNQTFQDFEVIILDDCSTDNSLQILDKYQNHSKVSQFIINEKNSGSTFKQWETGINLAKGKYVWIAETDDYSDLFFLEYLLKEIKGNNNIGIAFCDSYWIDDNNQIKEDLSIYKDLGFLREGISEIRSNLVFKNTIQNVSSTLINRRFLNQISTNYSNFKSCGDWILYVEILLHSKLLFLPKKMNYFRWYHNNTSNVSKKTGLWITEGIDVLVTAQKKIKFNDAEKKSILKFWLGKIDSLPQNKITCRLKLFKFSPLIFIKIHLNIA
jgi:glycosyltransferase involved in cell wall biosynthesis